jgi:hypothetical protein
VLWWVGCSEVYIVGMDHSFNQVRIFMWCANAAIGITYFQITSNFLSDWSTEPAAKDVWFRPKSLWPQLLSGE